MINWWLQGALKFNLCDKQYRWTRPICISILNDHILESPKRLKKSVEFGILRWKIKLITWDGPRVRILWMTVVISKVNVAGQVLFGWRLDFLTLFDHNLLVSLIDTTPPLFKYYPCFAPIFPFNLICSWHQVWPPRAGQWDGWVCSCLEEYFHVTIYQRCDSKSICQLQTQWSQWARRR